MSKNGRIELIIGPMFASKSTELIRLANRYKCIKKNILAINHKLNNRYGHQTITTHDKTVLDDCIITDNLASIKTKYSELYKNADIILIEELQFFEDAFDFVTTSADIDHKIVIAAGLSGDFQREPFGDVMRLIPHAESVIKLSALCKFCGDGTPAYFTKRLVDSDEKTLVGHNDKYEPVCRKHFLSISGP